METRASPASLCLYRFADTSADNLRETVLALLCGDRNSLRCLRFRKPTSCSSSSCYLQRSVCACGNHRPGSLQLWVQRPLGDPQFPRVEQPLLKMLSVIPYGPRRCGSLSVIAASYPPGILPTPLPLSLKDFRPRSPSGMPPAELAACWEALNILCARRGTPETLRQIFEAVAPRWLNGRGRVPVCYRMARRIGRA